MPNSEQSPIWPQPINTTPEYAPEALPQELSERRKQNARELEARQAGRIALLKERQTNGNISTDVAREISSSTRVSPIEVDVSQAGIPETIDVTKAA